MADPPVTRIVRLLRHGQLTIPAEFRRRLGIGDNTLLQLTLYEDKIEIVPVAATPVAGMAWVRKLHALFASIRKKARPMDEAADEVRSQGDDFGRSGSLEAGR